MTTPRKPQPSTGRHPKILPSTKPPTPAEVSAVNRAVDRMVPADERATIREMLGLL